MSHQVRVLIKKINSKAIAPLNEKNSKANQIPIKNTKARTWKKIMKTKVKAGNPENPEALVNSLCYRNPKR